MPPWTGASLMLYFELTNGWRGANLIAYLGDISAKHDANTTRIIKTQPRLC